ncbi:MAG: hypothetical protein QNK04_19530 [Myxococcota bacterium]|nr:hypothetical protein [Myxococcota bacterium]
MAARRTRRSAKKKNREAPPEGIRGEPLEPIRVVERELTRPDGTKLVVKVPVYPPFRLRQHGDAGARKREADEKQKAS